MAESYYINDGANSLGPYTINQLREMYRAGTINAQTYVWLDGGNEWETVSAIEHKFDAPPTKLPLPPIRVRNDLTAPTDEPKQSKSPLVRALNRTLPVVFLICITGWFIAWALSRNWGLGSADPIQSPAVDAPAQPPAEAPVVDLEWPSFQQLYGSKSNLTDIQKDDEWKTYKGQRVQWTGTLVAVQDNVSGFTMQVKMDPDTLTSDLLIYLRPSEKDKALNLVKGAPVTFTATFDSWGNIMPTTMTDGVINN